MVTTQATRVSMTMLTSWVPVEVTVFRGEAFVVRMAALVTTGTMALL